MKYLKYFLILLFIPFMVLAEECNINDVVISSIEPIKTNGNLVEKTEATAKGQKINLDLKVYEEGDSIEYKVLLKNTSNEDYYFDENSLKQDNDYMSYEFIYQDNSNIIKPKEEKELIIRVTYKNKVQEESSTGSINKTNNIVINLSNKNIINNPNTGDKIIILFSILIISLIIITISKLIKKRKYIKSLMILLPLLMIIPVTVYAICKCNIELESKIEIDVKEATFLTGPELNIKMKELSGNNNASVYTKNETIEAIVQSEEEPLTINKEEKNIVSTTDSKYPIYMWYDNGTIYWWSEDKTPNLNEDSSMIFMYLLSLQNIESIKKWDSSNVKNLRGLFTFSRSIVNVDALSNWNTSNVTNISIMFNYSSSLKNVDGIKNWDVSKVTTMHQVFCGSNELEEIDLSNWETSSLEMMANMFGMWNEQGQATLESKLKRIILSDKFNTSRVENFSIAFANLPLLEDYSFLKYIDTSKATNLTHMFRYNSNFNNTEYMKNWDVSNVENMSLMFYKSGLSNLEGLKNWNTSKVTNMEEMFYETQLTDLDGLIKWDTSNVTNMSYMFTNNSKLTNIEGIKNWNVSNVTNMNSMFANLPNLEDAPPINDWNINSSSSFTNMFYKTTNRPTFSKVPGSWNSSGTFIPS